MTHMQPAQHSLLYQQICVGHEHPLKHNELLPQLRPIQPHTYPHGSIQTVLLEYAPGFPGTLPAQQHCKPPLPPAPHASTMATP